MVEVEGEQGSGPEGVDDLCFHTYGEFSPPSSPPSPPPHPPPLPPALRPISQPRGSNPSLEAQIPTQRPRFQPQGPNTNPKAQITALRDFGLKTGIWASRLGNGRRRRRRKFSLCVIASTSLGPLPCSPSTSKTAYFGRVRVLLTI